LCLFDLPTSRVAMHFCRRLYAPGTLGAGIFGSVISCHSADTVNHEGSHYAYLGLECMLRFREIHRGIVDGRLLGPRCDPPADLTGPKIRG